MNRNITAAIILVVGCLLTVPVYSQQGEKPVPKEFAIPTSPLFDLMGAAPSQVARTSAIKDFKVDWSFRNWRVNPNLAIQAQPIWELFYNKKNLEKYQQTNRLQRMLASLDLSVGTIQIENGDRRIGTAIKMNLFQQKDPLLVKGAYDDVQQIFTAELVALKQTERDLLASLDTLTKPADLQKARLALRDNDQLLATYFSRRNDAIQEKAKEFINDNWNAAFIDLAYGKIYTYGTDSAGNLKTLRINRNSGNGLWVNFGKGIGKRGLVTGLVRTSFYQEEVKFNIKDNVNGTEQEATTIADNKLITLGLNFRYGGPVYNFFAEIIYEGKTIKTPIDAVNEAFTAPPGKTIVSSSVKWDIVRPYTINFGGDWRIGRNLVLNYGMRWLMDKDLKTISFTPIANISCMMR